MATTRPFAYNTGSTIDGTTQVGNIAIGVSDQDYSQNPGGVKWWMGPDEDLGYVIAHEVPTGDQPTPVEVDASIAFWRSTSLTDQSFLDLLNILPITIGLSLFTNVSDALTWLTNNNYFTSYTSFGSSGFQWMTVTSVTDSTASGVGQNGITAAITQSGGGMVITQGVFNPTRFPEQYGVPFTGNQIANYNSGTFTAIFSQPVTDALVAFASIGNSGLYVPIEVSAPFTPIFGSDVSYQNAVNGTQYTQLTGNEGYAIIRIDGTVTGVTFNYTTPEGYCNICFGFVDQNNLPTPTPTPTAGAPTSTPTPTPTGAPTNTPTPTPTPTLSAYQYGGYIVTQYSAANNACGQELVNGVTLWGPSPTFSVGDTIYTMSDFSTKLVVSPLGYYVKVTDTNNDVYVLTTDSDGMITDLVLCSTLPTPTPLSATSTPTPVAATSTPTPTPTPTYYYYYLLNCNLGDNKYGRSITPSLNGNIYNVDTNTCYTIVGNDPGTSYDYDLDIATLITDCTDVLCGLPATSTPTPAPTSAPTDTPVPATSTPLPATSTPTPTPTTVGSCSGVPYNLTNIFGPPTSGNAMWISNATPPNVSNLVNTLAIANPAYFNKIDNDGTDRTSYFNNFTGSTFTMTVCQNGNSATYTGISGAIAYDNGTNSFIIDGVKLSIVQSSPVSAFTFNELVYIDLSNGNQPTATPVPTGVPTDTPTPTPAPTDEPTLSPTDTPIPATSTPVPTDVPTDTPTPTPLAATSTPTPTPTTVAATNTPTPTPTSTGAGGWLFYNAENASPMGPFGSGNALFLVGGQTKYSPNYTGGLEIYFNVKDSTGTDYTSAITSAGYGTGGGTISFTQNGNTVTYTGITGGIGGPTGSQFLFLTPTNIGQQTVISAVPFVSGSTISVTFGSGTPTPTPTPGGPTATPTPTSAPTSTPTPTSAPTSTPTPLPATATPTPSATATNTPTPAPATATPTPTPIPSNIIVAAGGVNVLGYSYDGGDNWTNSDNGATFISQPAYAVATDGNMFVAGGTPAAFGGNGLLWSNDGNTWSGSTNGSTMFTTNVRGVGYGGDKWVAVGISSGSGKFAYSTDGKTWTAASNSNVIGSVPLSVAYNGSRWVAVGQSPAGGSGNRTTIAYSDDGISWTASANSGTIFTGTCWNVAWGGDKWVAVGTGANRIAYSSDGITWSGSTSGNSRITGTGYGIAYNGSQWIAAGQGTNALAYSSDGITWSGSTNGNTIFSFQSLSVTWVGTKWIAGGVGGPNQLATSTDGLTWSATTNGNTVMNNRVQAIAAKY